MKISLLQTLGQEQGKSPLSPPQLPIFSAYHFPLLIKQSLIISEYNALELSSQCRTLSLERIWLIDVSTHLPSSTIHHGFDVSSDQFAPRQSLPENVHLHEQDIFQAWPQTWRGKFDIVNIRFMITLLGNSEAFEKLMTGVNSILSEF